MTSVSTDRRQGVNSGAAIKVPCKAATTASITLSGEQTIDGVACVTGDRVLVKDNATTVNGIYDVDTGTWSRSLDFDGPYDVKNGTLCYVNTGGSSNGGGWFIVSCTDPVTIGTTAISFNRQNTNNVTLTSNVASAGQTAFTVATYQPGASAAAVYVNGIRARIIADYTESSTTGITFTYGLQALDEVDVYTGLAIGNLVASAASSVAVTDAGDFYVGTTVEQVLQEIAGAITADVGNADATLTYASSTMVQRWNTALTANRTATLSTSNAKEGATFIVVRGAGATGNYTLAVGSLMTMYAPGEWAQVRYDAGTAAWILQSCGKLPSAMIDTLTADVGNASATLTVGTSPSHQRWATTLTADRTATLSATGAWVGATFTVIRAEAASGNFSLIVADATATICRLAPGQYAEFEFTGSAWIQIGFGDTRPGVTSVMEVRDDFLGDEIDAFKWQSFQGTDASCQQAIAYADQVNGVIRFTTGADAGATMALNGSQVQGHLNWRASNAGLTCEIRLALDAITNVAVYLGFTDQCDSLEMPFTMAAGDVLTSNATDAVGVLFDTDATTDNWWLVGVAADIDATKQNSALAPVAATFETWRIDVTTAGVARFYRNGTLIGTAMAAAVTAAVKLTPIIAAFSRGAASRNIDVDEVLIQQQR